MNNFHPVIFLVDDDPDDLFILESVLTEMGGNSLVVRSFNDPLTLFRILEEETPDVLVVDYHLTLITGLDVTLAIRSKATVKRPNILIWSASASQEEALACLEAGADWFLTKPASYNAIQQQFQRMIDKWLS